jgi:hypothetical protein
VHHQSPSNEDNQGWSARHAARNVQFEPVSCRLVQGGESMETGQARATKRPRTERQLTQEQQAIINSASTHKPANHIRVVNATAGTYSNS